MFFFTTLGYCPSGDNADEPVSPVPSKNARSGFIGDCPKHALLCWALLKAMSVDLIGNRLQHPNLVQNSLNYLIWTMNEGPGPYYTKFSPIQPNTPSHTCSVCIHTCNMITSNGNVCMYSINRRRSIKTKNTYTRLCFVYSTHTHYFNRCCIL